MSGLPRITLIALSLYGFALSRQATDNIKQVRREADAGSEEARRHFTQTRYARVLGPRNSDLGMLFYGALALSALTGLINSRSVWRLMRLGAQVATLLSVYLLWALFVRLRVKCEICLKGHAVNLAVFVLLRRMFR